MLRASRKRSWSKEEDGSRGIGNTNFLSSFPPKLSSEEDVPNSPLYKSLLPCLLP